MRVDDYVFFYLSSKGTNTINNVFIFFVPFFKSKPLLRVQPQQHFPTLMGNGFESWRASIFFRLSFLSCVSWSLTAIIFFAFIIWTFGLITRKFERMELNCNNTHPFGGYTWSGVFELFWEESPDINHFIVGLPWRLSIRKFVTCKDKLIDPQVCICW